MSRRRVGLVVEGAPARHGVKLYSKAPPAGASADEQAAFEKDHLVGEITSGTMSPRRVSCLQLPVARARPLASRAAHTAPAA